MGEVSIIGLDLAKNVFQAHGAGSDGSVVIRRKLSRAVVEVRGGSVDLNRFRAFLKWISASVKPPPHRASAV